GCPPGRRPAGWMVRARRRPTLRPPPWSPEEKHRNGAMLLTNPTTRTRTLLALATGIALILSGCTVTAKQVTNVTVSSATLNAEVSCGSGSVSWQLREAGQAQWRTVAVKPAATCPKGVGGAPPPKTAHVSEPVAGLRASAVYEFRVG